MLQPLILLGFLLLLLLLPQENCVSLQLLLFSLILIWWVQKSIFPKSRQGLAMDATETFNQEYLRVTRKVGSKRVTEFLWIWNRSNSCVETCLIKSCIGGSCRPTRTFQGCSSAVTFGAQNKHFSSGKADQATWAKRRSVLSFLPSRNISCSPFQEIGRAHV